MNQWTLTPRVSGVGIARRLICQVWLNLKGREGLIVEEGEIV